jgi:predicted CopG family antitoxin
LQIKGIEDDLYEEIKKMAAAENRSVSQQVLYLVKSYISKKARCDRVKSPAEVLIDLHGSWQDEREADQIIEQVKRARRNSKSLTKGF